MKLTDKTRYATYPMEDLLKLAAVVENAEAQYSMACREEKKPEVSLIWLRQAAENGYGIAQLYLAFHYLEEKEFFFAYYWLDRAETTSPLLQKPLGLVKKALALVEERTALMQLAAMKDDPEPLFKLGKCNEELSQLVVKADDLQVCQSLHLPTKKQAVMAAFRWVNAEFDKPADHQPLLPAETVPHCIAPA